MSELTEHFVRHITLVVDNDQNSYNWATGAARSVVMDSGVSAAKYRAMTEHERAVEYAAGIGEALTSTLDDLVTELIGDGGSLAALLVRELMPFGYSDVAYEVGRHYVPEPNDMDDHLDNDDQDDQDDE